jgi:hypothetical protein
MLKYAVGAIATVMLLVYFSLGRKPGSTEIYEDDEVENSTVKSSKRRPASLNTINRPQNRKIPNPEIEISSKDTGQFNAGVAEGEGTPIEDGSSSSGGSVAGSPGDSNSPEFYGGGGGSGRSFNPAMNFKDNSASRSSGKNQESSTSTNNSVGGMTGAGAFANPANVAGNSIPTNDFNNTIPQDNDTTENKSPVENDALICSSSIEGGAFNNPIGVSLSCSKSAKIKYCLSENGCCDPLSSGETYSTKLVLGRNDGTYCLTFFGKGSIKGSEIMQVTYTFNKKLPNLQVSHPRTFYQTTELHGMSHIASDDFGKQNFAVGQINLRSHNPDSEGDDYNCEEVVTNYVQLREPTPFSILDVFGVAGLTILSQLNIPLIKDHLDYGDNYIFSYIVDNNHAVPMYSCSSRKITLRDFEFYQTGSTLPLNGVADHSGFSGAFTAYGFFENSEPYYRGPAGISTESQAGHELKSGLHEVFY